MGLKTFVLKYGSSQRQNLALTFLFVPKSVDSNQINLPFEFCSAGHSTRPRSPRRSKRAFLPRFATCSGTRPSALTRIVAFCLSALTRNVAETKRGRGGVRDLRWCGARMRMYACPPQPYRGTSLMRNRCPLGPYSRAMPRALWWS